MMRSPHAYVEWPWSCNASAASCILVHTGGRTVGVGNGIIQINSEINEQTEPNSVFVVKLTSFRFSIKITFSLLLLMEPHTLSETHDVQVLTSLQGKELEHTIRDHEDDPVWEWQTACHQQCLQRYHIHPPNGQSSMDIPPYLPSSQAVGVWKHFPPEIKHLSSDTLSCLMAGRCICWLFPIQSSSICHVIFCVGRWQGWEGGLWFYLRLQALQHRNLWSNCACLTDANTQMVSVRE